MNIGTKIADNYLRAKKEKTIIGMNLVDYQILNNENARIVVANSEEFDLSRIRAFVYDKFNYGLIPFNASFYTVKGSDGMNYASIIAYKSPQKVRPVKNSKLIKMGANTFLDEKIGDTWEKQMIGDQEFFVRRNDDDIKSILESVTARSKIGMNADFSFKNVIPRYTVGSEVEIYTLKDGKPCTCKGKITEDKGNTVVVKVDKQSLEIPAGAITKTFITDDEIDDVESYLRDSYNPPDSDFDYAGMFRENNRRGSSPM